MVIQTSTVPLLTGFVFNLFSVASIALSTHFFSLFHKGGQLRTCFSEAERLWILIFVAQVKVLINIKQSTDFSINL